jgi:hypothetical protein
MNFRLTISPMASRAIEAEIGGTLRCVGALKIGLLDSSCIPHSIWSFGLDLIDLAERENDRE